MRVEGKLSGCEGVGGCVCGGMKGNLSGCEGGEDVWGERGWGNCLGVRVGRMCGGRGSGEIVWV